MRPAFRRVLVVANPAAGAGRGIGTAERVARAVARLGATVEMERTAGPGDARRLAASAGTAGCDLVLVVGGDGTAHEAANGAAGTGVALGVAPSGTMNLLARVLGLPGDPVGAAELLVAAGRTRSVRPGRAGETLFLLMAGIGFDAWVLRELLARRRGKLGFSRYVLGVAGALGSYPYPVIRLETGGEAIAATTVVVGRSPLYGGFLRPTPGASLSLESLEIAAFAVGSAGNLLRVLPRLWSGGHAGLPGVRMATATAVRASSDHPDVPVQLDGEPAGGLPLDLGLSDRILRLAC